MHQRANASLILLQKALALHQKGDLAPAEELYKKVLVKLPDHFEANYLYGMLKLQQLILERRGTWAERRVGPTVPAGV